MQRNYLRKIIDHLPGLVFAKDAKGRFVMANKRVAEMYGLPGPEALIGKRVLDFHLGDGFAYNWEVTRSFFQQNFQIKGFETQEQAPDGREVWFSNHVLGVFNEAGEMEGVWGGQIDITERKRMELALFKSQQLQQVILEALPDMKFRIGADGVYLSYLSPGADDSTLSMEAEDFVGKHLKEVWSATTKCSSAMPTPICS